MFITKWEYFRIKFWYYIGNIRRAKRIIWDIMEREKERDNVVNSR
jgi:hypothetical protein